MSDFLAEVDEAMRQEKLEKFWHENKNYIIAFIALTILSTGILSAYRTWDASTKTKQTAELITLQGADNYPSNIIDAELSMRPSLRGIALLSAAGTFMEQDKPEEAAKLYARISGDQKIPDDLRFLGILMDVRLKMDKEDAQTEDLLAELAPVLNGKTQWKPHAQIDAAILQSEKSPQKALELLNAVADTPDLPASLYERAQKMHHVISGNIPENTPSDNTVKTN